MGCAYRGCRYQDEEEAEEGEWRVSERAQGMARENEKTGNKRKQKEVQGSETREKA